MKIPSKLESASDRGFLISPEYFIRKIPNAINGIYLNSHIFDLLEVIEKKFPKNIRFLLWDGYRPQIVQKWLFDDLFKVRKKQFPHKSDREIKEMVKIYVAEPNNNAPHLTGNTIDLTFFDTKENKPLEMCGEFDEFSERSSANFFENNQAKTDKEKLGKKNRSYLASIMKRHDFQMIESEWWHFQLI